MLFWSFVLAFVLGILYYNFYPRSDMINIQDKPLAESAVVGFVNTHQSAKKALYHFDEDVDGNQIIILDYVLQMPLVPSSVSEVEQRNLKLFFPQDKTKPQDKLGHLNTSMRDTGSVGLNRERLSGIYSFVACLELTVNQSTNQLEKTLTFNCDNEKTQNYVVTYMDQPAWWSDDVRQKELWRSALLRRTKGSDECGVLYKRGSIPGLPRYDETSEYVLDNSRRYILSVPTQVTAMMKQNMNQNDLSDYLFCITSISNIIRNAEKRSQVKYKPVETVTP